jgi:hypothetical protein
MYITRALIRPSKHGRLSCRCYFIKQLLYGFRVWMAWSKHLAMLLELRKARKITRLRLVFRVLFLTLATFPRVWIRPSKQGNHKEIVYSNYPPSITRQLPTAISTNASHFSHRTNKHLRNLRLFTRTPLGIYLASNFDHRFTYTQEASKRTRRNRQRNIIWFNPPFSRTKYAKHTIVNKGVKIWNSLDKRISSIMFYCTFKKKSKIFFL